jgi:SAM-dependent methyltransferase
LPKLNGESLGKYYPTNYGAYNYNVEKMASEYDLTTTYMEPLVRRYGINLFAELFASGLKKVIAVLSNEFVRLRYQLSGLQRASVLVSFLPFRQKPGNYLHIGSGEGPTFLRRMKEGWNVSAIDINAELMEQWREYTPVNAIGGEIKNANFADNSFDVIFMSHVVEHLTDPMVELQALSRWLKPDGVFVCELPLYGTWGWSLKNKYTYYDVPRHTIHFTYRTISNLMQMSGFKIRKVLHVPYCYGFFFADFNRFCMTGSPADSQNGNTVIGLIPWRHKALGYISWLFRTSGDICIYATKGKI